MPLKMYSEASFGGISRVKHILAVAAGKGGVGKSTVAVQLAHALKNSGLHVGVLDVDIYGPSIRKMLPEDHAPSQKGNTLFPALSAEIRTMSIAYFRREEEATAVRAPIATRLVLQFIQQVDWGNLDYLLVDFPPGTGDIQLTLTQNMPLTGALMVTTPQEVAVMDVRKALHLFEQVQVPILGVVENLSYYLDPHSKEKVFLFGEGGGKRLSEACGVPFLGQIPVDPQLSRCGDQGTSLFEANNADAPSADSFRKLALEIQEHIHLLKNTSDAYVQHVDLAWREMENSI